MKSFQAQAIRTCGAATVMVVSISFAEIVPHVLGVNLLPRLQMSLGVAVLVSLAAFLVANAPRIAVAESICQSSVAVMAVISALYVYKTGIADLGILDLVLALLGYALLGHMCRRVLTRRRAAIPT